MKKLNIAFDIDDCILVPRVAKDEKYETPNYEVIAVFKFFQTQGHHMILWSGSGMDWAQTWGEKFGLMPFEVRPKTKAWLSMTPHNHIDTGVADCLHCTTYIDIAFDDCDVDLAKVNVKVKRTNNSISRKEWNETKR